MDKDNFLRYIYDHKHGLRSDLVRLYGERTVRQLEATGFIVNAPGPKGVTWGISNLANDIASLKYSRLSFMERLTDWYYTHVLRVNTSV